MPAADAVTLVADHIRAAIVDGKLQAGDRLVEKQITETLPVSRHPVREALRLLEREGFVSIRRNRGAVVRGLEARSIREVYAIRSALGTIAIREIAGHGSVPAASLKTLTALAAAAVKAGLSGNQEKCSRANLQFQEAIVEATGMERVSRYFRELSADVQRFEKVTKIRYADLEGQNRKYVVALLDAMKEKDFSSAEKIWQGKFSDAVEKYVEALNGEADIASG